MGNEPNWLDTTLQNLNMVAFLDFSAYGKTGSMREEFFAQ